MTTFSFRKTAHRCIVRVTQSDYEWKMRFSSFPVLPGSAKAQVIWGGTVKRLLIAYFIGNISAKKCQNPFMLISKLQQTKGGTFFQTRCIWIDFDNFWPKCYRETMQSKCCFIKFFPPSALTDETQKHKNCIFSFKCCITALPDFNQTLAFYYGRPME